MTLEEKVQAFRAEHPSVVEVTTEVEGNEVVIVAFTDSVFFTESGEVGAVLELLGWHIRKDATWALGSKETRWGRRRKGVVTPVKK